MTTIFSNLRYATRMLVKSPGFSLVAIVSLAVSMGANTAIFSLEPWSIPAAPSSA